MFSLTSNNIELDNLLKTIQPENLKRKRTKDSKGRPINLSGEKTAQNIIRTWMYDPQSIFYLSGDRFYFYEYFWFLPFYQDNSKIKYQNIKVYFEYPILTENVIDDYSIHKKPQEYLYTDRTGQDRFADPIRDYGYNGFRDYNAPVVKQFFLKNNIELDVDGIPIYESVPEIGYTYSHTLDIGITDGNNLILGIEIVNTNPPDEKKTKNLNNCPILTIALNQDWINSHLIYNQCYYPQNIQCLYLYSSNNLANFKNYPDWIKNKFCLDPEWQKKLKLVTN